MSKVTQVITILMITTAFMVFPHAFAQSSANTTVSVKTDTAVYGLGDTEEISGSVTNPSYDGLYLKIFDSKAALVWEFQVKLDNNNTFRTAVPLSDPVWNGSSFYVVTAKTGGVINTTSFEIGPSSSPQGEQPAPIDPTIHVRLLQNSFFLPVSGIIVIGIIGYLLYSVRSAQKNIAILKTKSLPLITFGTPSPAKVYLSNGTSLGYESWSSIPGEQRSKVDSIEFWVTVKNIGGNAAKNITASFTQKDEVFSRYELKEKTLQTENLFPDLPAGEFYFYDFKISWDQFASLRRNNLFVGLLVSYDRNETRCSSGIIFGIGEGGNYTWDEWFS